MLFDSDGKFLTRENILRLSETPKGRKQLFEWLTRARSAFAAQRVMERLGVTPDEQTQQDVCLAIHETCFHVPVDLVLEYIQSMREFFENHEDGIHEC